MKNILKTNSGATLIEVLIGALILSFSMIGFIKVFIECNSLVAISGDVTTAYMEAQSKLEEIHNYDFDDIVADYASGGAVGDTFSLGQMNGMGKVYIDSSNSNLLEIEIVVSWEDSEGRIVGEDVDLDGILDVGEDSNGNGQLDSMTTLASLIADK